MLADWLSLISSEVDFRWIKRWKRNVRQTKISMESRTAHVEGRSWALLRYYTASEGLELGQQGVSTHNELGHAFTNVSTRPTIDPVFLLYIYTFPRQINATEEKLVEILERE